MKTISIKGTEIGNGDPKTIISVMGKDVEECLEIIADGRKAGVEMFEWRGDFNDSRHDSAEMVRQGKIISNELKDIPMLFTFRSVSQGGNDTFDPDEYVALNKALIEANILDIVDIETWIGDKRVQYLADLAHEHHVYALISYHNFAGTPSVEWMVNLMTHMLDLGADIPKVATMANDANDALKLLAATEEVHRLHTEGPLLTMAMGREGSITRLAGAYFGSSITFCALHDSSAPGQVHVSRARCIMDEFNQILGK
ncbi:MAG: type I 3-dehydroquinate dehydratase [Eggerthellaceae bacterium]